MIKLVLDKNHQWLLKLTESSRKKKDFSFCNVSKYLLTRCLLTKKEIVTNLQLIRVVTVNIAGLETALQEPFIERNMPQSAIFPLISSE